MKAYTKRAIALLLAALSMALAGCTSGMLMEIPGELPLLEATPPPAEAASEAEFLAELYFRTEDGLKLAAEQRVLSRGTEEGYVRALCEALAEGPKSPSLMPSIPQGLHFSHAELSAGVCAVYLEGVPPGNEQELLAAHASLAATLFENVGAEYVELFVNGTQPGYNGRPLGLLAPLSTGLDAFLDDTARAYDSAELAGSEATAFDRPSVALYFTDASRELLVAEARTLGYERSSTLREILKGLLDTLFQGPSGDLESALPADLRLAPESDAIRIIPAEAVYGDTILYEAYDDALWRVPDGEELIVELRLTRPADAFDEQLAYGAIVYTITGLCPRVSGVRLYLDGAPVETLGASGCFTREEFSHLVGDMVLLAFPESDGSGLRAVSRCLPQEMAYDPAVRVRALFSGSADPGVNYPHLTAEHLLSVSIAGDMAVVNWRAGFLEALRTAIGETRSVLPANTREQMIVYGVINTLCALPGVERVWMLEDGARIPEAAALIHLGGPLLKNPGLMLE